ncbi:MAG: DEAD/DEAH box helicase [Euryarchaeota archaeon]|jgi:ATP-dependent RNA helicase DeaD|nr:DEAD/DEAH box helicase [Euryarchaeota archaeon]MBT4981669.1 DEAD/DEAH box helicase [Euryarchaeota archaeon]MBT5185042.1 DEAD/DEAH box helicase [Euryarchaeota archaeon]
MFTTTTFSSWDLKSEIKDGLASIGWEFATQVQTETIPLALSGKDVIGQARTGSGKTAAFGLPTMNACQTTGELQALILTPTRELANQVAEELSAIQGNAGLIIQTVYGGTDLEKQARSLKSGVDIIVGTPGRVMDMTNRGHIDLAKPGFFVLDEADRMLDMGFFPDIMWVIERMTSRSQTLLFSATFPQEIIDAANEFMNEPEFVLTNTEKLDIPPIDQYSVRIGRANKLWVVGRLLTRMSDEDQTIIFANTKRMVDLTVQKLKKNRFDADGIHGDLSQNQREKIIANFKEGNSRILVATDVAARGIDVDGITLVINYDVPDDVDSYVHRIGRTGRIGRKGEAWVLVGRNDIPQLNKIIATHSLDIVAAEAPDLPEGVDREPVRKVEDNSEAADVFGMVPIMIATTSMSKFAIVDEITSSLNCNELSVGDIVINDDFTIVEVHNKHASLAVRSFNAKDIVASIIES